MPFKAGAIYGEARLDTKKWDTGLKKLSSAAKRFGAVASAAFVAAMTKSVIEANKFQKAMGNVASITDDEQANLQELTLSVLNMNPALGDATELTEALYQTYSAGASDMEEALEITENAAQLAGAIVTDTATGVDILTTAINAYGKENMTAQKASDLFFGTVKAGKITGEELSGVIGQSIPLFASSGVAMEELTAGIAAMTKQGVQASETTTQLNAIIVSILKPSEAMASALKEIGYESGSAFLEAEGLSGVLELLEEKTGGDAKAMADLIPNIRGLRGAMALTGVGGQEFNTVLQTMQTESGLTKGAFEEQEKTFATTQNTLMNLQILAGNVGKYFLDNLAVGVSEAGTSVLNFLTSTKGMELAGNIAYYVAGAFGALKEVAGILWQDLKTGGEEVVKTATEEFADLGGQMGLNVTAVDILGGAVQLLSSGIIVVTQTVVGGIKILKDWVIAIEETSGVVGKFFQFLTGKAQWSEVKEQSQLAGEAFKNLGSSYIETFASLWETVKGEAQSFIGDARETGERVANAFTDAAEPAKQAMEDNYFAMITGQDAVAEGSGLMADAINESMDEIEPVDETVLFSGDFESVEALKERYAQIMEDIGESTTSGYADLKATIEEAFAAGVISEDEFAQSELDLLKSEYTNTYGEIGKTLKDTLYDRNLLIQDALQAGLVEQEEANRKSLDNWKEYYSEVYSQAKEYADFAVDMISTTLSLGVELQEQGFENEQSILDNKYNYANSALEEKLESEVITQEEYDEQKRKLEEESIRETNELEKRRFEAEKRNKISDIWISAYSTIANWWETSSILGPIAGPIVAGTLTGTTLALAAKNTALVNQQEFVPAYATGGTASGLSMINEHGGEIVNLPDGTIIIPNDISQKIALSANAGNSQIGNINIYTSRGMNEEQLVTAFERRYARALRRGF